MDWTEAGRAVDQLIELIDDRVTNAECFKLDHIKIMPDITSGRLVVVAYNTADRTFKYAMYIPTNGPAIADGY